MTLLPFKDYYANLPDRIDTWEAADLKSFALYTNGNQKIGTIRDVLVDDTGHFRYLVVDAGSAGEDKAVLLPIGLAQFDYNQEQVFVNQLDRSHLQQLPPYHPDQPVDRPYEQRVRDVLLPIASHRMGRRFLQQPYTVNGHYQGTSSG